MAGATLIGEHFIPGAVHDERVHRRIDAIGFHWGIKRPGDHRYRREHILGVAAQY